MERHLKPVAMKKRPWVAQKVVSVERPVIEAGSSGPVGKTALGVGKKAACTIRRVDPDNPDDRAAIERLWLDNLPGITTSNLAERFDWLYRHNPAGQTLTWLAVEPQDGAVAGCASIVPRDMVINGNIFRGGIAIDFAIDRGYRSYGLAIQMQRRITAEVWGCGIDLVLAFPNDASRGVFQRMRYRKVGAPWRGAQLLRSASKLSHLGYSRVVAQVVGFGIDLSLRIRNAIALVSQSGGLSCAVLDAPDQRWESFRSRLLPGLLFAGSRDPGYLRWRYQLCPGLQGRYFCLLDEADDLLGYLVFSRRGEVLEIDDIQVLEERLLKPLLDRFWKEMRSSGAAVINVSLVGSGAMIDSLVKAGLVARDSEGWFGVLVSPGKETDLYDLLQKEGEKWYLVDAEIDL